MKFAIGTRRRWLGGGYDVLACDSFEPSSCTRIAWFRELAHAEMFAAILKAKNDGVAEVGRNAG
jgi:hypothetical protein